jgi:phosphoglycolate phosphatase
MPQLKTIIWDWNGTLLDDAEMCLASINKMLEMRLLPTISLKKYRDVFTFPVIEYYTELGFDFKREVWETVAIEFIDLYMNELQNCKLTSFATEALESFKQKGYRQAIISAMHHDSLLKSVSDLGIFHYFEHIGGISDHYAVSKIDSAVNYLRSSGVNPENLTIIGDTIHDSEVAAKLGCKCILVANGHQSHERLKNTGLPVVQNLSEVELFF